MFSEVHPAALMMEGRGRADLCAEEAAAARVLWGLNMVVSIPASVMIIFTHLDTVSLEIGPWGLIVEMKSLLFSVVLRSLVLVIYSFKAATGQTRGSVVKGGSTSLLGCLPGLEHFVSDNIVKVTTPLAVDTCERSIKCMSCPLAAVVSKMSRTVFRVSCLKSSSSFGADCLKKLNTVCTSQVSVYLGCDGLMLKTPLINCVTHGCAATVWCELLNVTA